MAKLETIEGIGEAFAKKLLQAGITTTESLLETGAGTKGRKEIAAKSNIASSLILRWVNHADLFRVKGIGGEYAELLEAAGVDSVPELGQRNAESLQQKLAEANERKRLVRKVPSVSQVKSWIASAKELPKVVTH